MLGVHQTLGGTGLFVPTDLGSTLKALYEGPGIVHVGSATSSWNDSSGQGNHLSVGPGGGYVADNGFGLPAATFDGSTQYLGSASAVRNRSFFAVVSDVNNPGGIACLCGAGRMYVYLNPPLSLCVFANHFGPNSGQTITAGRHSLGCVQRSATDMDFYLDGAMVNDTDGASFYPDTTITMCNENTSAAFQATAAHVEMMAICDTALGPTDAANMIGYMNRVYGK